ncbi:hypothetical protein ASD30_25125 [Nocardioides sp. Root140]|nr:hypothetical protein ASD30_25125 [Nocardioides sp. Root140]
MATTVVVGVLPPCDLCEADASGLEPETAAFDARTVTGQWAYLCHRHYEVHGVGLGTGQGQRLVLRAAQ